MRACGSRKNFIDISFIARSNSAFLQFQQFIFCRFRVLHKWVGELICLVLCCFFNIQFGLTFSWFLFLLIQTGFWISFKRFWFQLFFFSVWVFFHKHSRITGLQEKGEEISLTPHYHFHFTGTQALAGRLLQGAHLCAQLAAGLEPRTFDFPAQVANH